MWQKIKNYFKEQSKVEKKKLKDMTFKEKFEYIWQYYKIQIIIIAVVIIFLGSIINGILNPPTPAYAGVAIYEVYLGENFETEFERIMTEALIEDPMLQKIYIHSFLSGDDPSAQMAMVQKLMAMLATRELDLFIAENEVFERYISEGMLAPLDRTGVTAPEELLVYGTTDEDERLLAYGINLKNSAIFKDLGIKGEMLTIGVTVNTERLDNTIALLKAVLVS